MEIGIRAGKKKEIKKEIKISANLLNLYYGNFHAIKDVTLDIYDRNITAIIGPSGCGKSTLLRVFNRMNDLIPGVRVEGALLLDETPVYKIKDNEETPPLDVVALRRKVGMVFQKPNVFPMSIYDNVVIGPRHHGIKNKRVLKEIAEKCLTQAALWDEVKDILKKPALTLPLGAQQRLCIARALAVEPEVILMDESCSALDPESTMKIEDLMLELSMKYTIVIVTHNMEQAMRVSDMAAFMMLGELVEYSETTEMFATPKDKRTEDYITGRFG